LLQWAKDANTKVFHELEKAINATETIDLTRKDVVFRGQTLADIATEKTRQLAAEGRNTYRKFFSQEAREVIRKKIDFYRSWGLSDIVPIFESTQLSYPWELLYEGDIHDPKPEGFWGFRYPLGRNLMTEDYSADRGELEPPPALLFSVHRTLPFSYTEEWQGVSKLIEGLDQGSAKLIGASLGLEGEDGLGRGVALLNYLLEKEHRHNILHFACHCNPGDGENVLSLTLADSEDLTEFADREKARHLLDVELSTKETFMYADADQFPYRPLVFLNTCQAASDPDPVHVTFNLPKQFVDFSAAAVIATVCSVPDQFACAFAREFYRLFIVERWHIGEALRKTRLHFWDRYRNPMGLAYGLYTTGNYRLGKSQEKEALF
jgi:hypothetical protein